MAGKICLIAASLKLVAVRSRWISFLFSRRSVKRLSFTKSTVSLPEELSIILLYEIFSWINLLFYFKQSNKLIIWVGLMQLPARSSFSSERE